MEIVIAVMLVALLVAAAIPLDASYRRENALREPLRELVVLAKTARAEAIRNATPAAIIFSADGFALQRSGKEEPAERYDLPGDLVFRIGPWDTDKWLKPAGHTWVFQPSGICEPIRVRFTRGEAFLEARFDPLTADVAEESYAIP